MKPFRGSRVAQMVAASIAVVALSATAACSSDDGSDGSASESVAAPEGSFPGNAASGEPVKIGLINNEGGQAISMPENRESAEAVVQYANENLGGIGGRPIELVTCKQGEDANQARDCANKMVEAKVSAVLMTSSGQGNSMVPIITGAGIPYVSAAGQASSELTTPGAFMWTAGLPGAMTSMAKYSAQQGMKNVTAYVIDVPAATAGVQAMGAPAFQAAGVNLKVVPIPPGTPDATPQVSAGLGDKPDGVVVIGESTLCTSVFKALSTVSTTAEKMTIQPCSDPAVVEAVGAENLSDTKVSTASVINSDDPETQLYKAIIAKYAPDTDIEGFAIIGYQGMLGLVRATESVQGTDTSPAALTAAIKSAKDVPLPAGYGLTFTCDGKAMPGMPSVCGSGGIIVTFKDGELVDPKLV
ncbi:ABC transporter substrate-binding protein [Gordonia amicalis]|uniref:ABC transporter substrate-binding protein n=2 Tax=Gordonia amicalis TaxID=89053 RepID=UPI002954D997|nr:ABC transporter substrate-binding protein [Gordonia amicalis]MDV7175733.1 ABC transporter substrate-binding protein [Gordonia amicalis]